MRSTVTFVVSGALAQQQNNHDNDLGMAQHSQEISHRCAVIIEKNVRK